MRCTLETLAEDLERVLAAPAAERSAIAERGRVFVEREHAAPVLARRLRELYASILAGGVRA